MANSYDMQENLFQAIDTIVQSRIAGLPYDKTIECKVIDISKASQGIYEVEYQASNFECSSLISNLKLDDIVYVSIPQNDFRQDKIILAKKQKAETKAIKVLPFLSFVKGTNLFSKAQNQAEYSLAINEKTSGQRFIFDRFYGENLAAGYTKLGVKMAVNTSMPSNTISGNYGMIIKLYGYDQSQLAGDYETLTSLSYRYIDSEDENYCRTYYFDKKDMISTNIYNTHGYVNQEKVIDITNFVIDQIMIILWQDDDFKNIQNGSITNQRISYTNLQLYLGYDINDFKTKDTKLYIYTYDGLLYNNGESNYQKTIYSRILKKDDNNNFIDMSYQYLAYDTWDYIWEQYDEENTENSELSNYLGFQQISDIFAKPKKWEFNTGFGETKYGFLFYVCDPINQTENKFISNILWFTDMAYKNLHPDETYDANIDNTSNTTIINGSIYISGDSVLFKTEDGRLILRLSKDNGWFNGISNQASNFTNDGDIYKCLKRIETALNEIGTQTYKIIDD